MEDRAKYVLIGIFTFVVVTAGFLFTYWLSNTAASGKETAYYRVIFTGSVTGLHAGAPVLFNGIRVGGVTDLHLTDNPGQVVAMLAVNKSTPVRDDTRVTLEFAGLTGIASVSLKGALNSSAPLKAKEGEVPTLRADTGASQDLSSSVRESLSKVDAVIAENQESLHSTVKNLESFSDALARNGDRLDKLMTSSNEMMESLRSLSDNLDKRTARITSDVRTVADTANKQIEKVGTQATRSIDNVDKAVTDLTKHPQRFLFGGSDSK